MPNALRAGTHPSWTKAQIEELLRKEWFKYQNVELPYGLRTGGYDRSPTAERIFPADLSGKKVLDVGCSFGYFCFEALRRGASRAVGYDCDPDSIRKARILADVLGSSATFETLDVEREGIEGKFDVVLCLNLLHHLRDPLLALDRLIEATRERLVLEVATLGPHDRRKLGIGPLVQPMLDRSPVIVVGRGSTRGKREVQKFYLTRSALENLLVHQRAMFARLDTVASQHKGRFITIASKRRIGHLLVVSGATSAGKKTFMRRLLDGELRDFAARLGTPDVKVWGRPLLANYVCEPDQAVRSHVLLHHDLMRPYLRSTVTHERDEANDLIATAERTTFVTVWTPPERLAEQITRAEIEPRRRRWLKKPSKRHLQIREEYGRPERVLEHYRRWLAYTKTRSSEHYVLSLDGDRFEAMTPEEWEQKIAAPIELGAAALERGQSPSDAPRSSFARRAARSRAGTP